MEMGKPPNEEQVVKHLSAHNIPHAKEEKKKGEEGNRDMAL